MPVIQRAKTLPLDSFQVPVAVKNVPSEEGVLVTVEAVASLKIGTDRELLAAAVRRFLNSDLEQIKSFAQPPLEGGLRDVVATMTVEELVKNRTAFGSKVQEQVATELGKLGLVVDNFLIQEITDEGGYIKALGVKRTAEVQRDAAIAKAETDRDTAIRVAEAQRDAATKSAEAKRIGETAKAEAEQAISDANRKKDVQVASNAADVKAKQVQVDIAAQIAAANRDKELKIALVAAEEAETIAKTALQIKEKERHDAELQAALIVAATRQKEAKIIEAEATKLAAILTAEGQRKAIEELAEAARVKAAREADGAREAAEHEATGRKAQAAAQQAELEAQAEGAKAKLLADAEGQKAQLLAVAAGVAEKAKAYALLDQTGRLLEILKASPELVDRIGQAIKTAGEGTFAPMAQAIGTGLGNVDEIRIVDLGGSKDGLDPVSKLVAVVPKAIFNLAQNTTAIPGVADTVGDLLRKVGIDLAAGKAAAPAASASEPTLVKVG